VAQGLGNEIPSDAAFVAVLGPARSFLPEELATLRKYLDGGGRVLLGLDPEARTDLGSLAELVGLKFTTTLVANEKTHMRRRANFSAADNTLLVTNRYSSHASVSTLSRNSAQAQVIVPGASYLEKPGEASADLKIDFAVKSLSDSFADLDGNFLFTEGTEKRDAYNLAAAVSKSISGAGASGAEGAAGANEMRAFVMADADAFTDAVMAYDANKVLLLDAVRWLGGEESLSGEVVSAEDVRIEHTTQQDKTWFYGTIFGGPMLVLGFGLVVAKRSRKQVRRAS
jgi:hypothetical protein